MFTITNKVVRRRMELHSTRFPRGSGYCEDQWDEQVLMKIVKFRGRTILKISVDSEVIPGHVVISMGAFGSDSSGWKSKFSKYM
jgi:hypothetical protein